MSLQALINEDLSDAIHNSVMSTGNWTHKFVILQSSGKSGSNTKYG